MTVTAAGTPAPLPRPADAQAPDTPDVRPPAIGDGPLTDKLLAPIFQPAMLLWPPLVLSLLGTGFLGLMIAYTILLGPGVWGNNIPVAWAFPIINFVWWIGIGHAGTFISAFLLLMDQPWRASVNRLAEAMTLFALINAGLFPALHLGRPWFAYWLVPYPATMGVWPQWKSTLPWDFAAVSTYFTVSLLFWYLGLVPDLATARDRAPTRRLRRIYGLLSLGWRGTLSEWRRYHIVYGLLAGLATPLVISVHSIVSLDFAIAQLPGWHSTIFPPYFVVGAIYSGFAMVVVLVLPVRWYYGLQDVITDGHLDKMAKLMLVTAWMLVYSYAVETFIAWYSGNQFERYMTLTFRPTGEFAGAYWTMLFCNLVVPQIFWFRRGRQGPYLLFGASMLILLGMWLERYVIIVTSLAHDFLPSSWHLYRPSFVDLGLLGGSLALFLALFLIFIRVTPFVPLSEVKTLQPTREKSS